MPYSYLHSCQSFCLPSRMSIFGANLSKIHIMCCMAEVHVAMCNLYVYLVNWCACLLYFCMQLCAYCGVCMFFRQHVWTSCHILARAHLKGAAWSNKCKGLLCRHSGPHALRAIGKAQSSYSSCNATFPGCFGIALSLLTVLCNQL